MLLGVSWSIMEMNSRKEREKEAKRSLSDHWKLQEVEKRESLVRDFSQRAMHLFSWQRVFLKVHSESHVHILVYLTISKVFPDFYVSQKCIRRSIPKTQSPSTLRKEIGLIPGSSALHTKWLFLEDFSLYPPNKRTLL